ncbi:MAG: hypothetical protein HQK49_00400 [Oligoflexia bacterium]|nr:hypothetical protein [Oligoflexia bacterium]
MNDQIQKKNCESKSDVNDQSDGKAREKELRDMISAIGHELRQPLNSISLIGQSVSRDIDRDRLDLKDLKESMRTIVTQANRMSEIIDRLRLIIKKEDKNS